MKLQDKRVYPQTIDLGPMGGKEFHFGMTLLEHYAGLAMQGLMTLAQDTDTGTEEICARAAIVMAKALIAELEKNSPAGGGE